MATPKQPWHRGPHQRLARAVVAAAAADPSTRCLSDRCKGWGNRTLTEHPPTSTGKPPRWTAGHRVASTIATSIHDYRPEVNVCNYSHGATIGNERTEPHTERW